MNKPIRGRVAKILNSRELAMNIGTSHGVTIGMHFDVIDQEHENIIDPDTGESLGSLERPKVRVEVVSAQSQLSVGSTCKKKVNVGGVGGPPLSLAGLMPSGLSEALMPPKWVTKYETLKTEEKTWEDLKEEESYVKTGDLVVQAFPTEHSEELRQESEKVTN